MRPARSRRRRPSPVRRGAARTAACRRRPRTWAGLRDWALELFHDLFGADAELRRLPAGGAVRRSRGATGVCEAWPRSMPSTPSRAGSLREVLELELRPPSRGSAASATACWSRPSPPPSAGPRRRLRRRAGRGHLPGPPARGLAAARAGPRRDRRPAPVDRERLDAKHRRLLAAFASAPRGGRVLPARRPATAQPTACRAAGCCPRCAGCSRQPGPAGDRVGDTRAAPTGCASSPSFAGSLIGPAVPASEQEWRVRSRRRRDGPSRRRRRRPRGDAQSPAQEPTSPASTATSPACRRAARLRGRASGRSPRPRWSSTRVCPHAYFVERLLASSRSSSPRSRQISPLDDRQPDPRELRRARRPSRRPRCPATASLDRRSSAAGCAEIAEAKADELEARGAHRAPAAVAAERDAILADLERMLDEDNALARASTTRGSCQRADLRHARRRAGRGPARRRRPACGCAARPTRSTETRDGTLCHRHQDRQRQRFKGSRERPGGRRQQAPAARLRARGARGPRLSRTRRCRRRTGSSAGTGAASSPADRRGRGRRTPQTRQTHRVVASRPGLSRNAPPEQPGLQLGAVRLLQPRRARARRGARAAGSASARPGARELRRARRAEAARRPTEDDA